ncbi:hypothetical protein [Polynucleobacter sp. MWH-UH35A]|uniref:hypothetical protein n=1 Tax=Polynucleobacter sp. MWH-UH35A TaxID=1855619 RepID=UPI001BFCEB6D|nr:hypothetical protein [Polynucleobacter sp. MWH-UH35A]QWD59565.1 hypothetical protein ICV36_07075 [Polynucleobacter sp. MWH-UH35A]
MKKILVCLLAGIMFAGLATSASAHGGRGGYYYGGHGGGWHNGWVPFAVGAVAGVAVANAYYRPAPVYYVPQYGFQPRPHAAAFCPENGLYYPQTQACPSGWQRVRF